MEKSEKRVERARQELADAEQSAVQRQTELAQARQVHAVSVTDYRDHCRVPALDSVMGQMERIRTTNLPGNVTPETVCKLDQMWKAMEVAVSQMTGIIDSLTKPDDPGMTNDLEQEDEEDEGATPKAGPVTKRRRSSVAGVSATPATQPASAEDFATAALQAAKAAGRPVWSPATAPATADGSGASQGVPCAAPSAGGA